MSDAEDLSVLPEPAHLAADGIGRFAADVGVHLIEDEHGNVVLGGEHGFQCQHDAGDFAGRSDGAERTGRLAGVGSELELDLIKTGRLRSAER